MVSMAILKGRRGLEERVVNLVLWGVVDEVIADLRQKQQETHRIDQHSTYPPRSPGLSGLLGTVRVIGTESKCDKNEMGVS